MRKYMAHNKINPIEPYFTQVRTLYAGMLRDFAEALENRQAPIPYLVGIPAITSDGSSDQLDFCLYIAEKEEEIAPLLRILKNE
jgi:hypothetical protein